MIELSTFNNIVFAWIGIAFIVFIVLLKIPAPYGRHSRFNWGPMIDNNYGWFLMELPALVVFIWFLLMNGLHGFNVIYIFGILWVIHYNYRSLIFPFRINTRGKKMPVLIMLFAVFFNLVNGTINGYWFGSLSPAYPEDWITDFRFLAGLGLFVGGFGINHYHDQILIKLRNANDGGYKIPNGGLFRYISCPNFLGEIIEWSGFALMTWCLPTFSFLCWTCANLIPRAINHHKWYRNHFENYPQNRKAILPFIF